MNKRVVELLELILAELVAARLACGPKVREVHLPGPVRTATEVLANPPRLYEDETPVGAVEYAHMLQTQQRTAPTLPKDKPPADLPAGYRIG